MAATAHRLFDQPKYFYFRVRMEPDARTGQVGSAEWASDTLDSETVELYASITCASPVCCSAILVRLTKRTRIVLETRRR